MKFKLLSKVNIGKIISSHIKTLRNDNTDRFEFDDLLTFFIIPLFGATTLSYFEYKLSNSATNIIITTLSILVGLLFNVIVIIFDILKRDNSRKIKNKLLKQLLTNISYSIITSILIIVVTLLTYFDNCYVKFVATWLVYFLIGNYFLTVLMVLKRMFVLFMNEIDEIEKGKD